MYYITSVRILWGRWKILVGSSEFWKKKLIFPIKWDSSCYQGALIGLNVGDLLWLGIQSQSYSNNISLVWSFHLQELSRFLMNVLVFVNSPFGNVKHMELSYNLGFSNLRWFDSKNDIFSLFLFQDRRPTNQRQMNWKIGKHAHFEGRGVLKCKTPSKEYEQRPRVTKNNPLNHLSRVTTKGPKEASNYLRMLPIPIPCDFISSHSCKEGF